MEIEEIKLSFLLEFGSIADKFSIIELNVTDANTSIIKHVTNPGVYVFWNQNEKILKVGRHLTNSRKRALQHITDNTAGAMKSYCINPTTKLLLFNVINPAHNHWVAAVEIHFEKILKPKIKSSRLG